MLRQTVKLLVAERDWEPPRPRIANDQTGALRVAFPGGQYANG